MSPLTNPGRFMAPAWCLRRINRHRSSPRSSRAPDNGSTWPSRTRRTAAPAVVSSEFATVLDDRKIRARKRVFMTATPRYFTGGVVKQAREDDLDVASMDDETVFGPVFHKLTFAEAITRDLLTDYRVVIVGIDDDPVPALCRPGAPAERRRREAD